MMTTDRELLEAAAKAAGSPAGTSIAGGGLCMTNGLYWNPRDDDGDALRLAAKLGFEVTISVQAGITLVTDNRLPAKIEVKELHKQDVLKATRLAIVRAAAAKMT